MKHDSPGLRAALVGTALIMAYTAAACGGNDGGGSIAHPSSHVRTSSHLDATFNNVDVMFVRMMIPHHQQAVEMAALAETRAVDPQVKQLAAQIRTTQTAEIATMKRWLTFWGQPTVVPSGHDVSGMPSGMPGMPGMMSGADIAKLKAATGKDFDRQFLQMMIVHHKGAIQTARTEEANGASPDAKALAGRVINDQQAEIDTMQKVLARM
jgi:uncharacterized protein (DUF305 family)